MTDHHGFGFEEHHDPAPFDEPAYDDQHHFGWDDAVHVDDHHDSDEAAAAPLPDPDPHDADPHGAGLHDADPREADSQEAVADAYVANPGEPMHTDVSDFPDSVEVFPPAVDIGELPEPVDGFPWIDTGSLGLVQGLAAAELVEPVQPQELAEYAATELPPAADPWATLADSDDPATSALARWWSEN